MPVAGGHTLTVVPPALYIWMNTNAASSSSRACVAIRLCSPDEAGIVYLCTGVIQVCVAPAGGGKQPAAGVCARARSAMVVTQLYRCWPLCTLLMHDNRPRHGTVGSEQLVAAAAFHGVNSSDVNRRHHAVGRPLGPTIISSLR